MNIRIYLNEKKININDASAIQEYTKRLQAYCTPCVYNKPLGNKSFQDFHTKLNLGEHNVSYCVCAKKTTQSSEALAEHMNQCAIQGISSMTFFIGYPDTQLEEFSLSSMELSTGLTAVVLTEQLYRGYRILNNQPYHK